MKRRFAPLTSWEWNALQHDSATVMTARYREALVDLERQIRAYGYLQRSGLLGADTSLPVWVRDTAVRSKSASAIEHRLVALFSD